MNAALPVLDNLRVASPCPASWTDMVGDQRRRFCESCEKNVYDLTVMTPVEIVDLIEKTEGKFCGRLYQRADGRVLTADCPVGVAKAFRAAKRRTLRTAALVLAAAASVATYFGFKGDGLRATIVEIQSHVDPGHVAGGIAVDPVLMGDIAVEVEPPAESVRKIESRIIEMGEIAPE